MNIKEQLKKTIHKSLKMYDLDIDLNDIVIEIPKEKDHGDFSSNIAMKICKKIGKTPVEVANELISNIKTDFIADISIAGPGFINFFVNKNYLLDKIKYIIKENENYGKVNIGNNKKINLEFVSVNPTGAIHLGHARGACYGDSLARILTMAGYDVTKEYYINDAGNQMINMAKSIKERYKEVCGLEIHMEEDYYHGSEITDVAKIIYEENQDKCLDNDLEYFKTKGLEIFLSNIKKDLENIKVVFDVWTSEQSLRDNGKVEESLAKLKKLGYTYERDDAIWLKTSLFGDEKDRVIIKKDKSYTYIVPDIAYHLDKLQRGYDYLIDVLGADHHGYVPRLKAAVSMLGEEADKLEVSIVQMVRAMQNGQEYKLSKRTGKSITLNDLVELVGVDAIRYFFVSRNLDTQMDFDIDLAKEQSNSNPVYYVQYAHARICSILKEKDFILDDNYKFETITSESAYNVLSKIDEFPEIVAKSATKKAPHIITNYAYELATLFHSYYSKEHIITDNEQYTNERIALIKAVRITIANALNLIGVSSPSQM